MAKELVISSTPHETRVAILEDGQLCEIYVEREKEYALVGSIYKGRVTRVLPGMQSAFVDVGLDTDAFLYVSDVLKDLEEYDHIVSTVEGKVQKMEQQGGEVFDSHPGPSAPVSSTAPAPTLEPGAREATPPETRSPASPPGPRRESFRGSESRGFPRGRDRDRHSRFGRRGRGGDRHGGRELPPSKYAAPRSYEPSPGEEHEPIILPGESLAKYKDRTAPSSAPPTGTAAAGAEPSLANSEAENLAAASVPETPPATPESTQVPPFVAPEPASAKADSEPESTRQTSAKVSATKGVFEAPAPEPFPADHEPQVRLPETTRGEETASPAEEIPPAPAPKGQGEDELTGEEATALAEQLAEAQEEEFEAAAEEAEAALDQAEDEAGFGVGEESAEHGAGPGAEPGTPVAGEAENGAPAELSGAESADAQGAAAESEPTTAETAPSAEGEKVTARLNDQTRARFQRPMRRGGRHHGGRRLRPREHRPAPRRPQMISELLKAGQEIIVQIAKEPLGKKGARITTHVALPGRFLVYMPTVDHMGVSRKIATADQRARLRRLVTELKGANPGGFIVRTAAESASDEDLRSDVEFLTKTWADLRAQAEQRKAPALLHRDLNLVERILRDYLSQDYTSIWVDSEDEYARVLDFVSRFQPELVNRVKLYTKEAPIFEELGIQQDIDKSLRPKVWLKSGGYIVVNHTEALVAIDVNTGKYVGRGSTRLEDTIVRTNIEAVKEIVRQIRLRDLGGIIVVDFIDMEERRNREKVLQALEEALRADRAPSKVLPFNEFGLVAITRKRTKQALERVLCQPCPYCTGSGMVKSLPTICYEIQAEARKMSSEVDSQSLTLRVHPEIAKALKTRESSLIEELERLTHKNIIIQSDPTLHWEQYDIY